VLNQVQKQVPETNLVERKWWGARGLVSAGSLLPSQRKSFLNTSNLLVGYGSLNADSERGPSHLKTMLTKIKTNLHKHHGLMKEYCEAAFGTEIIECPLSSQCVCYSRSREPSLSRYGRGD